MAIDASKRVLEKAGVEGKDVDMIIFSSQVPELTFLQMQFLFMRQFKGKRLYCLRQ